MRSIDDLVISLHQRGISIRAQEGELRIKAAKGSLLDGDLAVIRSRRDDLRQLLEHGDLSMADEICPRPSGSIVPVTPLQARALREQQQGSSTSWWCSHAAKIAGPLDVCNLRNSIRVSMERHESLRTRFVMHEGGYRQHIDPVSGRDPLEVRDLTAWDAGEQMAEVDRITAQLYRERVDPSVGPLFRAMLFILSANEHVLVLLWEHLITDYASMTTVSAEVWTLYRCMTQQLGLPPPPRIQLGDYALWLSRTYVDWLRLHAPHWQQRLRGAPSISIPRISEATPSGTPIDATVQVPFGAKLTEQLVSIARREGTLPSMIVLTVYVAVMSRWCGIEDLVVWFVSNGRNRPELHDVTGDIAHHLPLRLQVGKTERFLDLLRRVESEFRLACLHDDFDRVPDLLPECRATSESYFNWTQPQRDGAVMRVGELAVETIDLSARMSPEFLPAFRHTEAGIVATVRYRADLYPQEPVERFAHNLRAFAREFDHYVPRW